ncbi:MAG: hypothetical protein EXR72_16115 [Myxococcales bacterium]|nr:hypothetical protein [Myxococcales bacterium]
MFWSKIWFFLLAVFAAGTAALLLLQAAPMQCELDAQLEARLQGAERGAGLLLKVHARKWLDAGAQVSADAQLYEALAEATRGGDKATNLDLVHRSAQARLRYFNLAWKTDQLIAVDARGRVVARAGLDEEQWRDDISGYPVVAEALRGYRLDDTWDRGGKLYRVTASPVLGGEHYVGGLLILQEIGTDLATRIRGTVGVEVAFLLGGKVIAQSSSLPILGDLGRIATERGAELSDKGRLPPQVVAGGDRSYEVVIAQLSGEAAGHDAAFALVAERTVAPSLTRAIDGLVLHPEALPLHELAPVGGGLCGVLLFGFLLMHLEHGRRARRLVRSLQSLSRGDIDHLDDRHHSGPFGSMVRAVNVTLDRVQRRGGGGGTVELAAGDPVPAPYAASIEVYEEPPEPFQIPQPVELVRPRAAPLPTFTPPPEERPPSAPPESRPPSRPSLPSLELPVEPSLAIEPALALDFGPPLLARLDEVSFPQAPAPILAPANEDSLPTMVSGPLGALLGSSGSPDSEDLEAEFQEVYRQYVDTKQRCGEATVGVTYDKFVAKLHKNRDQLMVRYACRTVRFNVYIKDGKAALKAVPVNR